MEETIRGERERGRWTCVSHSWRKEKDYIIVRTLRAKEREMEMERRGREKENGGERERIERELFGNF